MCIVVVDGSGGASLLWPRRACSDRIMCCGFKECILRGLLSVDRLKVHRFKVVISRWRYLIESWVRE